MKEKAYIIDAYSRGSYHEVINTGYLMMISELYKEVIYIADKSACKNLKKQLESCDFSCSNIIFREREIKKTSLKSAGLSYLINILLVSWYAYYYYLKSAKNSDVFYNNNLFYATILIHFFSFWKKNRIFDMCHNEMEHIDPNVKENFSEKFIYIPLRWIFCRIKLSSKLNYILLSPNMVTLFNQYIPKKNHARINWIDHCYIRPNFSQSLNTTLAGSPMKIGIPGAITATRGLKEVKELLDKLENSTVKIYALSFITEHINNPFFEELNRTGKLLPTEEYSAYMQQMDAVTLLYQAESYKLTASGAILDAIWNEKPILAIRNEYFSYLFERFGDLGILCDNVDELADKINKLDFNSFANYKKNLTRAKNSLLPVQVKEQLSRCILTH